jgi:uncharacterized protein with GYD domain
MAKYLVIASYKSEGAKGLIKDGGSARRQAVEQVAKSAGGSLESFYFAFGDADAYVVVDMPDHVSAAAVSLAVNATGAVTTKTVVLLTPEDIDKAAKKGATYRAPGQ